MSGASDRRRACGPWIAGTLLAVVLYVLSIGPAWRLSITLQSGSFNTAYTIVYAPIIWACKHSPACLEIILWYCEFWQPNKYGVAR